MRFQISRSRDECRVVSTAKRPHDRDGLTIQVQELDAGRGCAARSSAPFFIEPAHRIGQSVVSVAMDFGPCAEPSMKLFVDMKKSFPVEVPFAAAQVRGERRRLRSEIIDPDWSSRMAQRVLRARRSAGSRSIEMDAIVLRSPRAASAALVCPSLRRIRASRSSAPARTAGSEEAASARLISSALAKWTGSRNSFDSSSWNGPDGISFNACATG